MVKQTLLLLMWLSVTSSIAQVRSNTHALLDNTGELSVLVKDIVRHHTEGKQFVFLGEAFHRSGAELRYKTQFVRFLVNELGFSDIIFESDFYALYMDKDPKHIYWTWTGVEQCDDLFSFIEDHNIPIWGMDSKLHAGFSKQQFSSKLKLELANLNIELSDRFTVVTDTLLHAQFAAKDKFDERAFTAYLGELDRVIEMVQRTDTSFLVQSLKNLRSSAKIYMAEDEKEGIAERDRQMADNLDYLSRQHPDRKFIVWSANAHISKTDSRYMGEATMGCEFLKLNPDNSYHVAFGSVKMPYRKTKKLERQAADPRSLLHYLPDLDQDYFMDASAAVRQDPELMELTLHANLWSGPKKDLKTTWLAHFDAIVFIEQGELSTFKK